MDVNIVNGARDTNYLIKLKSQELDTSQLDSFVLGAYNNFYSRGSPLEHHPVALASHGVVADLVEVEAVQEVRRLLLGEGGLQHHAVQTLHADGRLVTVGHRLK